MTKLDNQIQFSNCFVSFFNSEKCQATEIDFNLTISKKQIQLSAYFTMWRKFDKVNFSICNGDAIGLN